MSVFPMCVQCVSSVFPVCVQCVSNAFRMYFQFECAHFCQDVFATCVCIQHTATHCNTLQHTATHKMYLHTCMCESSIVPLSEGEGHKARMGTITTSLTLSMCLSQLVSVSLFWSVFFGVCLSTSVCASERIGAGRISQKAAWP